MTATMTPTPGVYRAAAAEHGWLACEGGSSATAVCGWYGHCLGDCTSCCMPATCLDALPQWPHIQGTMHCYGWP